jgi:hypothetical protein
MTKILTYDCEIINCIPSYYEEDLPSYNYCNGWRDFKGMGISVIGTWRNFDCFNPFGKYEAFVNHASYMTEINALPQFRKFLALAQKADLIVGFNSLSFDDKLLKANGISITTDFDLLCEIREAVGMPRHYVKGVTRGGYNLNNLARTNLGVVKTGTGELAPMLWQDGFCQQVIDYCLNDVKLLKQLYFRFVKGRMVDPHTRQPINNQYFEHSLWVRNAFY